MKLTKRLVVELVFTLLFLTSALFFVYKSDLKTELQLSLWIKTGSDTVFRLFNGKTRGEPREIAGGGNFRELRFPIPGGKIEGLRLGVGHNPGSIQLKSVAISGLFTLKSYHLNGKLIRKVFNHSHGLKDSYYKNNCCVLETAGAGSWIAPDEAFYTTLAHMRKDKSFYYGLALVAALLFFLLAHSIDPGIFRTRLPTAILVNGILIFLLVMVLPISSHILTFPHQPELSEQRRLSPKPEFRFDSLFEFFHRLIPYYNDHFEFRGVLVYMNNLIKVKLLGVSPAHGVMLGKKGWLFLDKQNLRPGTIDYYRALSPMTPEQLNYWKRQLEKRRDWLAAKGIDFLFVVAPNKNTIYPEFMPDHIRKANPVSRLDQLLVYLKTHSTVPFIDLRPALLKAKTHYPVYSATDTHWNDYGAYIANREIIHYISSRFKAFAGMEPLPLSRFKVEVVNRSGGDMAIMLSLQEEVLREDIINISPVSPLLAKAFAMPNINRYVKQRRTQQPAASTHHGVVMVHDSFYKKLMPYLSEQFSRVLYIWDWDMGFFPEIIEREKPKLVINEMAERFLLQ